MLWEKGTSGESFEVISDFAVSLRYSVRSEAATGSPSSRTTSMLWKRPAGFSLTPRPLIIVISILIRWTVSSLNCSRSGKCKRDRTQAFLTALNERQQRLTHQQESI